MSAVSIKKDQLLFEAGDPVNELYLILKGSFSISFPGGEYTLSNGEVIGICELQAASHQMNCKALEDATLLCYPVSSIDSLETLFNGSPGYCTVFVRSAFRQMNTILELIGQSAAGSSASLEKEPGISTELISAACSGYEKMMASACTLMQLQNFPETSDAEDMQSVQASCSNEAPSVDTDPVAAVAQGVSVSNKEDILLQTTGSLQTILNYSQADTDFCLHFDKLISLYKNADVRKADEDASRSLRMEISAQFYELYSLVFFRAIEDSAPPLPIRMFLYFGFVDEQLAGTENTIFLGQTAERLALGSHGPVYTLYDWLIAIYNGSKEPSRNEFDQDYTDYLHSLKVTGKINAAKETALFADAHKKVEYELKNMFPSVNKMTFGRISTFCPVFSAANALKTLDASLVSADALKKILGTIQSLDYSAFYREYLYSNTAAGIPRESFHTEVMPDIILMPNIGTRGVMWQEIEGRRRTTSARMMLPVFYLEDLYSAVVRLVGEYRWEMCKRIQGPRWNDVSDPSLTSEYFDYIQFYRKSHDLSADAKERIKASLLKAHGSFKEMFIRDYVTYILFESSGSPRLTKPARTILSHYCPFSKQTRETLMGNPLYKETLEHYELRTKQQLHKIELLEKKLEGAGLELPAELVAERLFYES
ncbi:MAG: Crp/Fnr family transcriptional regulator [Lachnospiraceae bacterium]